MRLCQQFFLTFLNGDTFEAGRESGGREICAVVCALALFTVQTAAIQVDRRGRPNIHAPFGYTSRFQSRSVIDG